MPAIAYTRATMRAEIWQEVQDPTGRHFTAEMIHARINNRMADFLNRVRCRRHSWTIDLHAEQGVYDLTNLVPRCLEPLAVSAPLSAGDTQMFPLERMELTDLERYFPRWRTEVASWPRRYARVLDGPHAIMLHPRPQSSQAAQIGDGLIYATQETGGITDIELVGTVEATQETGLLVDIQYIVGGLRIDGIAGSTDLSSDGDSLETVGGIPVQWQQAIKAGVLADLYGDVSVPISQVQKAGQYAAEYEGLIAQALSKTQYQFQGRPGQAGRANYL